MRYSRLRKGRREPQTECLLALRGPPRGPTRRWDRQTRSPHVIMGCGHYHFISNAIAHCCTFPLGWRQEKMKMPQSRPFWHGEQTINLPVLLLIRVTSAQECVVGRQGLGKACFSTGSMPKICLPSWISCCWRIHLSKCNSVHRFIVTATVTACCLINKQIHSLKNT